MKALCRSWLLVVFLAGWLSAPVTAQTDTVIPDTDAAQHVGQKATVEGTFRARGNKKLFKILGLSLKSVTITLFLLCSGDGAPDSAATSN